MLAWGNTINEYKCIHFMDKTIKAFESALKDNASEMEGCWIEVDEVKREQEQESE